MFSHGGNEAAVSQLYRFIGLADGIAGWNKNSPSVMEAIHFHLIDWAENDWNLISISCNNMLICNCFILTVEE